MGFGQEMASGLGGVRTSGDLVARMLIKGMKINDAKEYVAKKLGISTFDLSDVAVMRELRENLDIGFVISQPGKSYGMEAKIKIAKLLDIEINSVNKFMKKAGLV